MPNQTLHISNFDSGIISAYDIEDIPIDAASISQDVENNGAEGKLLGRAEDTVVVSPPDTQFVGAKASGFIKYESGGTKYDLIYHKVDNTIRYVTDFYGSMSVESISQGSTSSDVCIIEDGTKVHIGTGNGATNRPLWLGRILHKQFSASTFSGLNVKYAELINYCNNNVTPPNGWFKIYSITPNWGDNGYFNTNIVYRYDLSFIYDGFQESLLSKTYSYAFGVAISTSLDIQIRAYGATIEPTSFNCRITGLNLYRQETGTDYTGLWRLVKYIDINDPGWTTSGNDKCIIIRDEGIIGATYEDNTGISESLPTSAIVNYSLATLINNTLIVGRCYHSYLPEASYMLFKSKPYRYDTFDWSKDYLLLPTIPTTLTSFNNRIYAFDSRNTYVINPDSFQIEETIIGIGCFKNANVVTNQGMFWCDKNNIYQHIGQSIVSTKQQIITIGDKIKTNNDSLPSGLSGHTSWQATMNQANPLQFDPIAVYAPLLDSILFVSYYGSIPYYLQIWVYHIGKKRWDRWITPYAVTTSCGGFTGHDNFAYLSLNERVLKIASSNSRKTFYWVSKVLPSIRQSLRKYFSKLKVDYGGAAPTVKYGITDALTGRTDPTTTTMTLANGEGTFDARGQSVRLYVTAGTNTEIYSINTIYREMIGDR